MSSPSRLRLWLRPGLWWLHVAVVASVLFCLFMGLWQLGAYDARQENERADRRTVPTVALDRVLQPGQAFPATANHRPVTVSGVFAPAGQQFWVDGKSQGGAEGRWLVAPLITQEGDRPTALLVVRGWTSGTDELPEVPVGEQRLRVILEPSEQASSGLDSERVIGSIRIPALINEIPYELYSAFGISTTDEVAGDLALVPPPEPEGSWASGLRNLVYAVQWWVFGAFAVFMWWRMGSDNVASRRASAPA